VEAGLTWKDNLGKESLQMKAKLLVPILALLTLTAGTSQSQTRPLSRSEMARVTISVNTGWQFRELERMAGDRQLCRVCVHTDLLTTKLIEDPFYRDNEQRLQWIGKTDWEYQTTFNVTPEILARDNVELVFEGLDTYANIFLNNESLLNADNMFRTWRVDSKPCLKRASTLCASAFVPLSMKFYRSWRR